MQPTTSRERFRAIVNFEPFDRLPLVEWAVWWNETIERWYRGGLDSSLKNRYDLYKHFGLEQYKQIWVPGILPSCPQPATPWSRYPRPPSACRQSTRNCRQPYFFDGG